MLLVSFVAFVLLNRILTQNEGAELRVERACLLRSQTQNETDYY